MRKHKVKCVRETDILLQGLGVWFGHAVHQA